MARKTSHGRARRSVRQTLHVCSERHWKHEMNRHAANLRDEEVQGSPSKAQAEKSKAPRSIARRADEKLEFVAQTWVRAFGGLCTIEDGGSFLERGLVFRNTSYLDRVALRYEERNLLFAKTFDLVLESTVEVREPQAQAPFKTPVARCRKETRFPIPEQSDAPALKLEMRSNRFCCSGSLAHLDGTTPPRLLACRLDTLGVRGLTVSASREPELCNLATESCGRENSPSTPPLLPQQQTSGTVFFTIQMTELVGSSTWNLIPPVLQLIEPTPEDCVAAAEALRITASLVSERRPG